MRAYVIALLPYLCRFVHVPVSRIIDKMQTNIHEIFGRGDPWTRNSQLDF